MVVPPEGSLLNGRQAGRPRQDSWTACALPLVRAHACKQHKQASNTSKQSSNWCLLACLLVDQGGTDSFIHELPMATTVTVYAAVTSLWLLGAITAYYVLRPLLFACAHCAVRALWKSPRELLLDVKRQLRRRRLSDLLFYLVLGTVIALMVALNLPEPAARSRNVPPPGGGGGGHQSGWDDASAGTGGGANDKEYYDLLGLPPGASWDDIKRAYRALSLEWHPDKHPPHKHIYVKTVFMQITEAYEYFKDRQ